jgi:cellulose synthase/poly-beta-1,6-N-acetylglucosamine synthase-like glycosyltransferase
VIIPSYFDPYGLAQTIESIQKQNYPREHYEIIPVVNVSTVGKARNIGVKRAEGEIIVFIDSDMIAPKNWLREISKTFEKEKADIIGAKIEMFGKDSLVEIYDKLKGFPVKETMMEKGYILTGCMAIKKSIFNEIGLFREDLEVGEDTEFGLRTQKADKELFILENITLLHPAKTSMRQMIKRQSRQGRAYAQLWFDWLNIKSKKEPIIKLLTTHLPKSYWSYSKAYSTKNLWTNIGATKRTLIYSTYLFLWGIKFYSMSYHVTKKIVIGRI